MHSFKLLCIFFTSKDLVIVCNLGLSNKLQRDFLKIKSNYSEILWIIKFIYFVAFSEYLNFYNYQGRHSEFEPDKAQYSTPIFLTGCFL